MKKNILKYSSLLALLGSTFFSTQTFAAECATGTVPATGCRVDVSNITYTLTGDITSGAAQGAGILFDSDSAIINYTGAISVEAMGVGFDIGADNNTMNMTGNINIAAGSDTRRGVIFNQGENNTFNLTGNILTANEDGYGVIYSAGSANIGAVEGNITTSGLEAHGIAFDNSRLNNHTQTGNITTAGLDAYGIYLLTGSESNTINMTGDISTTSDGSSGVFLESVGGLITNSNTINITGNITTAGGIAHGIFSLDSDSNTYTVIGDINTTGFNSRGLFIRRSDSNTINMTGNISTIGQNAYGMRLGDSHSNVISFDGNITTSGSNATGVYIRNSNNNITTLSGNISTTFTGDGGETGLYLQNSEDNITTLIGNISVSGENACGLHINEGINNTTTLTGNISTTGDGADAVYFRNGSDNNTINMTGNISTIGVESHGIKLSGSDSNTLNITGDITTTGIDGDSEPILLSNSDSNTITLSGSVQALGGDQAISLSVDSDANTFIIESGSTFLGDFENLGSNTVITNQGTMDGIENTGSIATFNNAQTGATYSGTLPVNYNIIINSPTSYGQMFVTSEAGSTNFGVSSSSDNLTIGQYTNVMTGVSDGNVGATRSGSLEGNGTSGVGTANWVLTETASGSSAWDLNITGDYVYFGSVATLQNSVNNTASAMRGAFNSITSSMNFANMTTYDCNLFGNNGGCVSVGGRYTGTDNPDTTATAVVAKAGYKFNEHFRYGAFVDQTANSKTGNVDMDMNTPMVGLMGVWNQNPDQLGMQVKLANTFQSTDASITRNDGLSTNYTGDTDINAQSYVAELSWRHLNNQKDTLLQPFVATRYAIIDQDGYSDGLVNYGSVEQKTLTALAGVKAFYQYSHKMTYMGSLGVEHDLDEDADDLSVSVSGVSGLTAASMTDGSEDKTRLLGSVGARFFVTPNQRLEGKVMYEQLRYNNADNTTAYVNYTIGF